MIKKRTLPKLTKRQIKKVRIAIEKSSAFAMRISAQIKKAERLKSEARRKKAASKIRRKVLGFRRRTLAR